MLLQANRGAIDQQDILDDGEPPNPRAGQPAHRIGLRCIVLKMEHLPVCFGPPVFSIDLQIGDTTYHTPMICGDAASGRVQIDQLFDAYIDAKVLDLDRMEHEKGNSFGIRHHEPIIN